MLRFFLDNYGLSKYGLTKQILAKYVLAKYLFVFNSITKYIAKSKLVSGHFYFW